MSKVAETLTAALSDTYVLYMKTHSYHWNVEGPHFQQLHTLFEQQYTDMWTAVDEIAERLRALDVYAPKSYAQMAQLSSIAEETEIPEAREMVKRLVDDNARLVETLKKARSAAQEAEDEETADMMIQRTQIHQKFAWMMRSFLK